MRTHPAATLAVVCCTAMIVAGCRPIDSTAAKPKRRPLEGVTLRLVVADDPALAKAIAQLRGEWNAQTGADVEVAETTSKALLQGDGLPTDAAIVPTALLGLLAERHWLAPVPPGVLGKSEWTDVFELARLRETAWGGQTLAVPFGSPVLCCYYRADLLESLRRAPPRTWAEYQELAKLLAERKPATSPWAGTIEPLAPGWAGLVLLARAAPALKHRDNFSALFDIETMEPRVAGPPMVHALESLVAAAKVGPSNPLRIDPAAARAAFWKGECGMALAWPTAADATINKEKPDPRIRVGFVELPGSPRVFNLASGAWETRAEDDDTRVPLLGVAGRLGVVSATSKRREAAFQLLLWLSDGRMSPQTSAASEATTLFRRSQLKSPSLWVEKPVGPTAALQYGDAVEAAMRHEQWLGALPIAGRADYLAALDEAVAAAVSGRRSAHDALAEADAKWRAITKRLGAAKQRAAYRHSLGLD